MKNRTLVIHLIISPIIIIIGWLTGMIAYSVRLGNTGNLLFILSLVLLNFGIVYVLYSLTLLTICLVKFIRKKT